MLFSLCGKLHCFSLIPLHSIIRLKKFDVCGLFGGCLHWLHTKKSLNLLSQTPDMICTQITWSGWDWFRNKWCYILLSIGLAPISPTISHTVLMKYTGYILKVKLSRIITTKYYFLRWGGFAYLWIMICNFKNKGLFVSLQLQLAYTAHVKSL